MDTRCGFRRGCPLKSKRERERERERESVLQEGATADLLETVLIISNNVQACSVHYSQQTFRIIEGGLRHLAIFTMMKGFYHGFKIYNICSKNAFIKTHERDKM